MLGSESFPFTRVSVDHLVRGNTRVWWDLHRNFKDPSPRLFQLQAGYAGTGTATDWVDVGPRVEDGCYAEDDEQRLHGKRLLTHYRVKVTTPLNTFFSGPASVHGEMGVRDWNFARDIIRKEILRHRLVSREGYLLKRIRYGVRCQTCLDQMSDQVTDSKCPDCRGVGFEVGYHAAVPMICFDLSPRLISEKRGGAQPPGQQQPDAVQVRALGYPDMSKEDIWVDGKSDQRWYIHDIQHVAEWRGVPVVKQITMRMAPMTDVAYELPIPGAVDEEEDLPDSGCGSVEVTHDYGGEDALAYQLADGCPVAGATVLAFPKSYYDAGLRQASKATATTTTLGDGRWSYAMKLDPGEYMLVYEKPGEYGPDPVPLTVLGGTTATTTESSSQSESESETSSAEDFGL